MWGSTRSLDPGCARPAVAEPLEQRVVLAAGALDPTFGAGGILLSDFPRPAPAAARTVVVQPDGKFLAAGLVGGIAPPLGYTPYDFAIARFHPDGTPDATFGTGGRALVDFGDNRAEALDLALAPGGKILVA